MDKTVTPTFSLQNGKWYFIAGVIEPNEKKFTYVVGDRSSGVVWKSDVLTFTGTLNASCIADLVIGMHADTYYYAGGFDEWFLDCDSALTADDLVDYFNATILCNGADSSSDVDALTDASGVTLKATDGVYPESGVLYTKAGGVVCPARERCPIQANILLALRQLPRWKPPPAMTLPIGVIGLLLERTASCNLRTETISALRSR